MPHSFQVGDTLRYADKVLRVWPEYEKFNRFEVISNDGLFDLIQVKVVKADPLAITIKVGEINWMDSYYFEHAATEYIPELAHIDSDDRFDIDL